MSRTLFFASLMLAVLLATTSSFAQNLPGPFKERINLCNDPADLIIVWDGSSSISPEEYQDEVNFVGDLISELNIAERTIHAGLVQFDELAGYEPPSVKQDGSETLSSDKKALEQWARKSEKRVRGTNCGLGMNYAEKVLVNYGRTQRDGTAEARIVVFVTDGDCYSRSDFVDLQTARDGFTAAGIVAYAIGVGNGVNQDQLELIAGSPKRVYSVEDFSELRKIVNDLVDDTCNTSWVAPSLIALGGVGALGLLGAAGVLLFASASSISAAAGSLIPRAPTAMSQTNLTTAAVPQTQNDKPMMSPASHSTPTTHKAAPAFSIV